MPESLSSLRKLLERQYIAERFPPILDASYMDSRPLICTPYLGAPGVIDGWIVCVSGDPPAGTLHIKRSGGGIIAYYFLGSLGKCLDDDESYETLRKFYDDHLRDQNTSLTIEDK